MKNRLCYLCKEPRCTRCADVGHCENKPESDSEDEEDDSEELSYDDDDIDEEEKNNHD